VSVNLRPHPGKRAVLKFGPPTDLLESGSEPFTTGLADRSQQASVLYALGVTCGFAWRVVGFERG
jgi:hypothetical protein